MLEHPILMNPGFMSESVGANNRFVRLHRKTGNARYQFAGGNDMHRVNSRIAAKVILASANCHHDFLQRGIACTLAQPVHRAFHLPRAVDNRGQGICHR